MFVYVFCFFEYFVKFGSRHCNVNLPTHACRVSKSIFLRKFQLRNLTKYTNIEV